MTTTPPGPIIAGGRSAGSQVACRTAAELGAAAYRDFWRDPWTVERHVDELLRVYAAPPA